MEGRGEKKPVILDVNGRDQYKKNHDLKKWYFYFCPFKVFRSNDTQ